MNSVYELHERWKDFAQTRRGQLFQKVARYSFLAAVLGFLAYQFTEVGWMEIYEALPTTPWFYIIFGLIYFSLPLTESFMYRLVWDYPILPSMPMYIKKKVYNQEVFGYSGEIYLFLWAKDKVAETKKQIALTIKDNNIISSVASTLIAVLLLGGFLVTGQIELGQWIGDIEPIQIVGGVAAAIIIGLIAIRFRKYILSLSAGILLGFFLIHCARLIFINGLQVAQWWVVLPDVSLTVWFTFLAALIILSRFPIPNRDLIFVGAGVELSAALGIPEAPVAGMLLVNSVLHKGVSFLFFLGVTLTGQDIPDEEVEPEVMEAVTSTPEEKPATEA